MQRMPDQQRLLHASSDRDHHQAVADFYDDLVVAPRRSSSDRIFSELGRHLPARSGAMLDLGAGTGHMTMRFGHRFDRVVLVDHSAAMLAKAREKAVALAKTQIRIETVDALEFIGRTDERFDLVTCVGFLHHLVPDDIEFVLKNVRRILRPNGRLVIGDPVRTTDREPALVRWWNRASAAKLRRYLELAPSPDEAPIDVDVLRDMVKSADLTVLYQRRCWEVFDRFGGNAIDRIANALINALAGGSGAAWFGLMGPRAPDSST